MFFKQSDASSVSSKKASEGLLICILKFYSPLASALSLYEQWWNSFHLHTAPYYLLLPGLNDAHQVRSHKTQQSRMLNETDRNAAKFLINSQSRLFLAFWMTSLKIIIDWCLFIYFTEKAVTLNLDLS